MIDKFGLAWHEGADALGSRWYGAIDGKESLYVLFDDFAFGTNGWRGWCVKVFAVAEDEHLRTPSVDRGAVLTIGYFHSEAQAWDAAKNLIRNRKYGSPMMKSKSTNDECERNSLTE